MTAAITYNSIRTLTLYVIGVAAVVCVFATAVPQARAAQLTETQIQAVLNLLASFNVNQSTIDGVDAVLHGDTSPPPTPANPGSTATSNDNSTTTPPTVPPPHPPGGPCAGLTRDLRFGDDGSDVEDLQNLLTTQGFLDTGNATGFFGHKTEKALKIWQATQGLVSSGDSHSTGWGALGPKSRSLIARLCNPSQSDTKSLENVQGPGHGREDTSSSTLKAKAAAPTCTLTVDQPSITPGAAVTLTWISTNAIYASSPNGINTVVNGSKTVAPTTTTIYQKTVYGKGGSAKCQVTVSVTQSQDTASTTPPSTDEVNIQMVLAEPRINLASVAVAVAQFPLSVAINSLTDLFVQLGIGQ